MRVAATYFHDAVMTIGIDEAADLFSRLSDDLWVTIFVKE
jgi:hypothetical protein